jgi:hypothetical protein
MSTCRASTQGPDFHWFGYYDKFQFDPTGRYMLGMARGLGRVSESVGVQG